MSYLSYYYCIIFSVWEEVDLRIRLESKISIHVLVIATKEVIVLNALANQDAVFGVKKDKSVFNFLFTLLNINMGSAKPG